MSEDKRPPDFKEPANCFNCRNSVQTKLVPFSVKCSKYKASSSSSYIFVCSDWTDNCEAPKSLIGDIQACHFKELLN